MNTPRTELQARRERLVLDHFADETRQDFDAVLGTFPHPHYELIPSGEVHDALPTCASTTSTRAAPSRTSATKSSSCGTRTTRWSWSSGCWARTAAR
nr:hypothetical protein [Variovorax sp. E3]